MCLGIPGRIVEIPVDQPDMGRVDVEGVMRGINLSLLADDPPVIGDWVLIHLGFALEKMTGDQVAEIRSTRAILHGESADLVDPGTAVDRTRPPVGGAVS